MSDINRIQGNFRGLLVQNKNNNILKMDQAGNFSLSTKTIENISYQKIINISENESIYTAKKNDLILSSEEGSIILRNGTENQEKKYQFSNPSYSIADDTFFDSNNTNEISKPFGSTEEVNNLRENSFLIESLGDKSMCLYSNNGLNQVSHGNLNIVGDSNILLQASQKLNLTSMGYILLNSERLLTAVEEDIHILSSTGEFKVGGDGIDSIGLKVNSNLEKNFTSLGRFEDKADRSLHIDIQEPSYDNTVKNGILVESKSLNNSNTFPDIKLINYDKTNLLQNNNLLTQINLGIGSDNQDINNSVFVERRNVDGITYLFSLNNFKFINTDINKVITYIDTNLTPDTIKTLISETQVEIKKIYTDEENTSFNYQQAHINRDNHGHLKTKTNSDLHLGTNKNDIISIKNTGNIGINTTNPQSTLDIENSYGNLKNIRTDKNTIYQGAKSLQMKDGNFIIFYNTKSNSLYNLEASIYNINNDLVTAFTIYENSYLYINFSIDNLKGIEDKFVVTYSYFNNLVFKTESKIFSNSGNFDNINYSYTHESLTNTTTPQVKSFQLSIDSSTGSSYNGYIIVYKEKRGNNIEVKLDYLSNNSSNLVGSVEITNELNTYLKNTIEKVEEINTKNIKYINLEYNPKTQKFLIACSGVFNITDTESNTSNHYLSFVFQANLTYNTVTSKPVVSISSNFKTLSNSKTVELLGFNLKLKNQITQRYIYSYYHSVSGVISKVMRGEYNNNTGSFGSQEVLKEDFTENISSLAEDYIRIPQIDILDTSNFIIVYVCNNIISYYQSTTNSITQLSTYSNTSSPFIISLLDNNNAYLNSILFFNNKDDTNLYVKDSINFIEILGVSNIMKIKNNNNNIQIKNTGDISIQDILEISKSQKTSTFERLVIKTETEAITSDTPGITGELRVYENEIYTYLNGWKKLNFTSI